MKKGRLSRFWIFIKFQKDSKSVCNAIIFDIVKYRMNQYGLRKYLEKNLHNGKKKYAIISCGDKCKDAIGYQRLFGRHASKFPLPYVKVTRGFRYNMPMGRAHNCNYNTVAKKFMSLKHACSCDQRESGYNQYMKRVVTGDLEVLKSGLLKQIMERDTNYRPTVRQNEEILSRNFNTDMDEFCYRMPVKYSLQGQAFFEWRYHIVKGHRKMITEAIKKYRNHEFYENLTPRFYHAIKKMQDRFVITYIDKSANNYALICKSIYISLLKNAYNNNNFQQTKIGIR